jgi:hypothetical protein
MYNPHTLLIQNYIFSLPFHSFKGDIWTEFCATISLCSETYIFNFEGQSLFLATEAQFSPGTVCADLWCTKRWFIFEHFRDPHSVTIRPTLHNHLLSKADTIGSCETSNSGSTRMINKI